MPKIDIFPHILPRKYWDRLQEVALPRAHMMKRMGRFLTLLSECVPETEKTKESMTEQQIEELWERAQ